MRVLIWSLVSVFIVLSSFFITLSILDYRDRLASNGTEQAAGNVSGGQGQSKTIKHIVFNLSLSDSTPNWQVATNETTTQITGEGLLVKSRVSANQNELTTDKIVTEPERTYIVHFAIAVTKGSIALGILDVARDRWILVHPIDRREDSFRFAASANLTQLVIVNAGSGPNTLTVTRLVVEWES
jgi:hypothetical protein